MPAVGIKVEFAIGANPLVMARSCQSMPLNRGKIQPKASLPVPIGNLYRRSACTRPASPCVRMGCILALGFPASERASGDLCRSDISYQRGLRLRLKISVAQGFREMPLVACAAEEEVNFRRAKDVLAPQKTVRFRRCIHLERKKISGLDVLRRPLSVNPFARSAGGNLCPASGW